MSSENRTAHMGDPNSELRSLIAAASACRLCEADLPLGPNPLFQLDSRALILIAGQSPGRRAHLSGTPWDDASGDRLRKWMGIDRETFYDKRNIAVLPMGFCYPGTTSSGDLAPRPECAPAWRRALLNQLHGVRLTLVIGRYAIDYHLPTPRQSLTESTRSWRSYGPNIVPLPHPSPRNQIWLNRNPWFERELLPALRQRIAAILTPDGSPSDLPHHDSQGDDQ